MMNLGTADPDYVRECLSFDEKIALAKLEEAKATERVRELEYQKSRFGLDWLVASQRAQQQAQVQPTKGP